MTAQGFPTSAWNRFAVWLLTDPQDGMTRYVTGPDRAAIEAVAGLHQRVIDGDTPAKSEWEAVRSLFAAGGDGAAGAAMMAARASTHPAAARAAVIEAGEAAWEASGNDAKIAADSRMLDKLIHIAEHLSPFQVPARRGCGAWDAVPWGERQIGGPFRRALDDFCG